MTKPKIEEFMVFENEDGKQGIIIRKTNHFCKWWKCFTEGGGQVFDESTDDDNYNSICRLYKVRNEDNIHFAALSFMHNRDLSYYDCIYDCSKSIPPNISKVSEKLNQIGIQVKYIDGNYRPFNIIMEEISKKWNDGGKEIMGEILS